MLIFIKRAIILSKRLQSAALWFYALVTMFLASLLLDSLFAWASCFCLQLWSRISKQRVPFSVHDFWSYWFFFSLVDSVIAVILDFKKLKWNVSKIQWPASVRSIPYRWNFLLRWAYTPLLLKYLIELGLREPSIGPPNLILDMAFGQLTEPSWTDVKYYTAGGDVWGRKVRAVSLKKLNHLGIFWEPKLLIAATLISLLKINIKEFYYGRDSDASEPWVLAEIVWIPTMIISTVAYSYAIFLGVLIPLLMGYQNYKGWRANCLSAALWNVGRGIAYALFTKFLSGIYNYVVFESIVTINGGFLWLMTVDFFLLLMTKSRIEEARNWYW